MSQTDTRFTKHVMLAVLVAGLCLWCLHLLAEYGESIYLHSASPEPLATFANLAQAALVLLFCLAIGVFIHRYQEPYFVFWYLGWVSWIGLYSCRIMHLPFCGLFNGLNSSFFLASAAALAPAWRILVGLNNYPPPDLTRVVGPFRWTLRYLRANPLGLAFFGPALIIGWPNLVPPAVSTIGEGLFTVLAYSSLALGLYWRMRQVSEDSAAATLIVFGIYMVPQIAKVLWPASETHPFDNLLKVAAPALVMKPVLGLFVVLLVFRETAERRDRARRRGDEILERVPEAFLVVRGGRVESMNARAREILGGDAAGQGISDLFNSPDAYRAFEEELQSSGRLYGHAAQITLPTSIPGYKRALWAHLDAFYSDVGDDPKGDRELYVVILDRHGYELATAVFSMVHDHVLPRLRILQGTVRQLFSQALQRNAESVRNSAVFETENELNHVVGLLGVVRESFKGRPRPDVWPDHTANVLDCLGLAWTYAKHHCGSQYNCDPTHRLQVFPPGAKPLARIPSDTLRHILQNLYTNAIASTYESESRVELSPVYTVVVDDGHWVLVRIVDRGGGMPQAIMNYLNNPLSGIPCHEVSGLHRVRIAVACAGGSIRATSNDEGGVSFEVSLPGQVVTTGPGQED